MGERRFGQFHEDCSLLYAKGCQVRAEMVGRGLGNQVGTGWRVILVVCAGEVEAEGRSLQGTLDAAIRKLERVAK